MYHVEGYQEIIQNWGYFAVLLGSMVEGESVILTACVMAHLGYLSIYKIAIIAFLGTLFADQGLYYLGRYHGHKILKRYPRLQEPSQKAFALLHRWDIWFILIFRFVYGIRTVSPIVIGTAGVKPSKFIPLNLLAAFIWTTVSCTGGYMLGHVIELIGLGTIKKYLFSFSFGLLALLIIGGYFAWKKLHLLEDDEKK